MNACVFCVVHASIYMHTYMPICQHTGKDGVDGIDGALVVKIVKSELCQQPWDFLAGITIAEVSPDDAMHSFTDYAPISHLIMEQGIPRRLVPATLWASQLSTPRHAMATATRASQLAQCHL